MSSQEGLVVRTHGGHYFVQTDRGLVDCTSRGRLKKERAASDLLAVGDKVHWSPTEPGSGVIEEVLPRKSALSRCPPPPRPQVEQVIVANVDLVLVVFSVANPTPNPLMLDRYLVACEAARLPLVLVANKTDLDPTPSEHGIFGRYRSIGYEVCFTSTLTSVGLEDLHARLRGKIAVLTGPSGVGKSSLLNAIWPKLALGVGEVSQFHDRGRHTTVVARLLNPEPDTYVTDTPGLRQWRFWNIDPEQLDAFFPEMRPLLGRCRFQPCTHIHEPDCAVRAAVGSNRLSASRYDSYCRMFRHGF